MVHVWRSNNVRSLVKKNYLGPIFVFPSLVLIFMILVFPIFYGFYLSLFNMRFLEIRAFAGLRNFAAVLGHQETIRSIIRSIVLSVAAGALTILVGFWIACWADKRDGRFGYAIQLVGLVPWVISMVVGALLWKWIFSGDLGLYNYLRDLLGLKTVDLLGQRVSAIVTLAFVIMWRTVGYSMIMILAGLKTVSSEMIDATKVDGCNLAQRLWHVVVPLIKTPILIASIVVTLSNINNVTVPMTLTGGGPANSTNVVSLELYRLAFVSNNYGFAAALAVVVFLINVILVMAYLRLVKWDI